MSEEQKVLPAPSDTKTPTTSIGLIFIFILLLALAGSGGYGGYWLWQQSQANTSNANQAVQAAQQHASKTLQLEQKINQLHSRLAEAQNTIEQSSLETKSRLQALSNEFELIKGSSRKDWLIAEAEYLLRIANQRLLIERDVSSSRSLLQAADQVLAELADPAFMPVRMKIAEDVFVLEASIDSQVEKHAIALTAMSNSIASMQLRNVERIAAIEDQEPTTNKEPNGNAFERVVHKLRSAISKAVRIHRADERFEAPPTPEYSAYLVQNLGLRIEQARLFLLRGQYAKYQAQLINSGEWLNQHFPSNNVQVEAIKKQLRALETSIPQDHALDISASLTLLQEIIERKYRNQELGKHSSAEDKALESAE